MTTRPAGRVCHKKVGSIGDNLSCEGRVVTKKSGQLVITCHVRMLSKGEVLGSRNAKRTNSLHGTVSDGSHVKG